MRSPWLPCTAPMPGALNLTTGNSDRLPGDCAGALAAQPEHGSRALLRRDQSSLRIMFRELRNGLLAAAPRLFHDVLDAAGDEIRVGETGTHCIDGHVAVGHLESERPHETDHSVLGRGVSTDIGISLEPRRGRDRDDTTIGTVLHPGQHSA